MCIRDSIYLDSLDHLMAGQGFEMVRYADDFVVLCRSPQEAAEALAVARGWTAQAGLTLHPVKTRLVHAWDDGFDFLGYHFERGRLMQMDRVEVAEPAPKPAKKKPAKTKKPAPGNNPA